MEKKDKSVCDSCWQKNCGMKGSPMSWEEMNYTSNVGGTPQRFLDCFFLVCDRGEEAARSQIGAAESEGRLGLVPFGTYDKPHHDEPRPHGIVGRFVVRGDKTPKTTDGDVVVVKNGQTVTLTSISAGNTDRGRFAFLRRLGR